MTMETSEIVAALKDYIAENILSPEVQIDEDTNLQNAGVDSFATVEIILFIERKFGVMIPDDKLVPENFQTLGALSKIVFELMPLP
jgi:acyl carrier protein